MQLLHLLLKFYLSKLLQSEKPYWILSQNSEYPRIFWVTGANQNTWKLLSTDLVNTNGGDIHTGRCKVSRYISSENKQLFVNYKCHSVGTLCTIYKHFGDFVKCIFTILLQIQHENHFYLLVNTDKLKFIALVVFVCATASFILIFRSNFFFRKCLKTRHHLGSGRKTVNSQGYSKSWEPIKTSKNCYSLIW